MELLKVGLVCMITDNFDGNKRGNAAHSREQMEIYAQKWGFTLFAYPELVFDMDDANRAAAAIEAEHLDFLMVQTTNFPGGNALIRLAKCCKRLGIWGLPEHSYEGSNFVNSNNSLCGLNMASSIIKGYLAGLNLQSKWFFGHADDPRFTRRLELTVRALGAIKRLARSRVALVGGIAPGFNDLYYDERIALARLGVEIQRGHEFSEIHARAHAYPEAEIEPLADCYACARCGQDVTRDSLRMGARYYRAYSEFARDNGYDALAVSCWPQIKSDTLACSVIGKLNQALLPASCEGDVPGAVSMLLMRYLTEQPPTLMDLCALDEADDTALMWHCGPAPEFYADEQGATTACSYQLTMAGDVLSLGTIHDMVFKKQPLTFMCITGEWDKMFLLSGQAVGRDKVSPDGSRGWVGDLKLNGEPIKALDLMNTLMVRGFQHHYPMMAGDLTDLLMETASWLGLSMLKPVAYRDYLQNDVE